MQWKATIAGSTDCFASNLTNLIEFVELVREDTKRQYETVELIRTLE